MKKSTLIKVLCIVLATLFALSLVACGGGNTEDEGEKVTVYFDPNGGTLEEGVPDEIQVTVGEKIGRLPTPVRPGYEFLGWYEDGNERWEITRKDEVEDEMELVALWSPLGDLVTVEFAVASGETLNGDVLYVDIVKGQRINSALQTLPTASKDDYIFKGWKDASGITVTVTTKVESDLVLYPVWERIVYCLDGFAKGASSLIFLFFSTREISCIISDSFFLTSSFERGTLSIILLFPKEKGASIPSVLLLYRIGSINIICEKIFFSFRIILKRKF